MPILTITIRLYYLKYIYNEKKFFLFIYFTVQPVFHQTVYHGNLIVCTISFIQYSLCLWLKILEDIFKELHNSYCIDESLCN